MSRTQDVMREIVKFAAEKYGLGRAGGVYLASPTQSTTNDLAENMYGYRGHEREPIDGSMNCLLSCEPVVGTSSEHECTCVPVRGMLLC